MREELAMFVNDNYPPVKVIEFNRAFEIFDDYGIEDYDTPFMDMLGVFDNSDYSSFISEFESKISNTLLSIIKDHGITLVEDIRIDQINNIAQALLDIQYYEDKDSIARILETHYDDDHEKLAELLNLAVPGDIQSTAILIEEMNDNLFNKLELYISDATTDSSEAIESSDSDKLIIANLKNYRSFINRDEKLIVFKVIEMGFTVGLDFDVYGRYLKRYVQDFSDIRKAAEEYFATLLAAKQSHNSPLNYYRKISSEYIDDLEIISKMDVELSKIYNEFDKFKTKMIELSANVKEYYYYGPTATGVPAGQYEGKASGYDVVFRYNGQDYVISSNERGVKGKDIACTVKKHPSGYFTVEFNRA
jgi:hypothetical protein